MLNKPIISIDSFRNYASKLTVGSVTERASVQAILDRIAYHLCDNYPNEDLTLVLSVLSPTNSPSDKNISYHGIAVTDEVYNLNESKSATGYHLHIYKERTDPIRSVVLSLSQDVGHEVFGNLANTAAEFTLTTIGYPYDKVLELTEPLKEMITVEQLTHIDLSWSPESHVVKTFTIGDEWHILTGADVNNDGTWNLTHRPCTPEEIPTSVTVPMVDDSTAPQTDEQVLADDVNRPAVESANIRRKK